MYVYDSVAIAFLYIYIIVYISCLVLEQAKLFNTIQVVRSPRSLCYLCLMVVALSLVLVQLKWIWA